MLGHLQNMLDDIQASQDKDEPSGEQGQYSAAASTRGRMSDKLWLKERITAWKDLNIRAIWFLCGEKPGGCNLSRVQLQRVFQNTTLASSAVVKQLNASARLDVTAFMPRGPEPGTATNHRHSKAILHSGEGVASRHFGGTLPRWRQTRGWTSYAPHSRTASTW